MQNPRVKVAKVVWKAFFILGLLQKAISDWGRGAAAGDKGSTWFLSYLYNLFSKNFWRHQNVYDRKKLIIFNSLSLLFAFFLLKKGWWNWGWDGNFLVSRMPSKVISPLCIVWKVYIIIVIRTYGLETRAEPAVLRAYVENQAILEPILLYRASKQDQTVL